jgi:hypothetical protein
MPYGTPKRRDLSELHGVPFLFTLLSVIYLQLNTSIIVDRKSGDLSVLSGVTLAMLTRSRGHSHRGLGMRGGRRMHGGQL